jgi:hypothetical protein
MPRGDKSAYTAKQKRQARDIEKSYEEKGISEKVAAKRAWATVNKLSGGGKLSGSGRKARKTAAKSTDKTAKPAASRKSPTRR